MASWRQALDRRDTLARRFEGQVRAGADGLSVYQDGAGPADLGLARAFGAGEAEPLAHKLEQGLFGADFPRHGWPLIWRETGIMCHVCKASAISMPPVGAHGLGQRAAEEHPCQIRLVCHRSMEVVDRLQDLLVMALRLP